MELVEITERLKRAVGGLRFAPPVRYVYNPLEYAWEVHEAWLRRYGAGQPEALWLGMNPGPWGMAQTGVPFGEVSHVRDWMGLAGPVGRPDPEHPKRPIQGFDCPRREVSGDRLWGWARARYERPEAFFERHFVVNYCPLVFMEESGRNFTPDKLPAPERAPLFEACDAALLASVRALGPRIVVGVGAFAAARARAVLAELPEVEIGQILHPSPASPAANRGWAAAAERQLEAMGLL